MSTIKAEELDPRLEGTSSEVSSEGKSSNMSLHDGIMVGV